LQTAINFLNSFNYKEKNKCYIVKIKKYYVIRCYHTKTNTLSNKLKQIQKEIKDAFIAKMYKWRLQKIIYPKPASDININYNYLLYKADYFFQKNNLFKSLKYYKKAFKFNKNPQIAINISYIEGLLGLLPSIYTEKTLYAYSLGAIKTNNNETAKSILQNHLSLSKEGYLEYVLGYLYQNNKNKSLHYYKTAVNKNPFNIYFIYAYARALDICQHYNKALKYYKMIDNCDDIICRYAKQRIRQLLQ
jgi:hypothetical protein